MNGFNVYSQLGKSIATTKDGGVSFKVHTKELNDEDKLAIMKYAGSGGWVLFRETEVKEEEVPPDELGDVQKPIHRRIRGACYFLVEAKKKAKPTDDEVSKIYHAYMDDLLETIKDKIDNLKSI